MIPEKNAGIGWTLTLLDTLLSEYPGGTLPEAIEANVWRLPLAQAFALYAAVQPRYGIEPRGPTYVELAMIRARRAASRR